MSPTPPARPASTALPTLVPGRDREPVRCRRCGSRLLDREEPSGRQSVGRVWCVICGAEQCWLGAPTPGRIALPTRSSGRAGARPIITSAFGPLDGCAASCSALYGHDPLAHERYGRSQLRAELRARPAGVVQTGPLVVDYDQDRVWVGPAEPVLSGLDRAILAHLAARLDRNCRHWDLAVACWGEVTASLWAHHGGRDRWHVVRIAIYRLRERLGAAASLLLTVPNVGYRLAYVAP